jgi:hypothetical protein
MHGRKNIRYQNSCSIPHNPEYFVGDSFRRQQHRRISVTVLEIFEVIFQQHISATTFPGK